MTTLLFEKRAYLVEELLFVYEAEEAEVIAGMLIEEATGLDRARALAAREDELDDEVLEKLDNWLERLLHHEPVQYVLGHAWFYGLKFHVRPGVLIPRGETEELVDLIIKEHDPGQERILDIGTGSGCIAISLKKNLPSTDVTAIDISAEALAIAKENGHDLNVRVKFGQRDILKWRSGSSGEKFDIIVSNPPYVTGSDRKKLARNVVDFEPEIALFVSDSNPLLFYREITDFALLHLNPQGKLYFEINESCGQNVVEVLKQAGFEQVRLIKDLNGKDRFVAGRLL